MTLIALLRWAIDIGFTLHHPAFLKIIVKATKRGVQVGIAGTNTKVQDCSAARHVNMERYIEKCHHKKEHRHCIPGQLVSLHEVVAITAQPLQHCKYSNGKASQDFHPSKTHSSQS